MTTDQPPLSPCRRNDRHDAHVYEVYGRPFQCPGYTPAEQQRTDAKLLAELAPLAVILAEKLRTVPVRLIGRGGADDLISELTLATAVYCAKHVLPTGPAPVDRAAVLNEAAAIAEQLPTPDCAEMSSLTNAWDCGTYAVATELRRLADEAQQP